MKPKLLLHACCGCCAAWIPKMLSEEFSVTLYFFNPNIHPQSEYLRRLESAKQIAIEYGINFIAGKYNPLLWFDAIKGYENEPEMGARCPICFEFRMQETASYAKEHNFDIWSTTLTVGRNKKADTINPIGERIALKTGTKFLARDFKKQSGLDTSVEKAKECGIYMQNYCGCAFSKKEQFLRKKLQQNGSV
ncbi:epoxyqueuosine reductase QueH [Patescibacteria group bacterium]|nr:epoxyqueuosine reductase QueH [Patescibacteria group bacterium]